VGEWRALKVVYREPLGGDSHLYDREFDGVKRYEPVSRDHPGLVQVLHVGRDEAADCFYYVMELADDEAALVEAADPTSPAPDRSLMAEASPAWAPRKPATVGRASRLADRDPASYQPRTLASELRRRGRLPVQECVEIGIALADALAYLHASQLVHRDIKPSNIIFVGGRPKLADIGLVTALEASRSFVGTPGYTAPEGPGTAAADLYALGKVLYQMGTGQPPTEFPALPRLDEWTETDRQALNDLNAVILKACAAQPSARYASADALRAELQRLKEGQPIALHHALKRRLRHLQVWVATLVALLLVFGPLLGVFVYRNRSVEAALRAQYREQRHQRMGVRVSGWFAENWATLERAARWRPTAEVLSQAAASLAGWDAEVIVDQRDAVGSAAAFAPDGTALVAGDARQPARLVEPTGTIRALAVCGEGPVAWSATGQPLQLQVRPSELVLVELRTGRELRLWQFGADAQGLRSAGPVLALSADAARAAAGFDGPQVRLVVWDATAGVTERALAVAPSALAFSPDATMLAVGDAQGDIGLYTAAGLEAQTTLPAPGRRLRVKSLVLGIDPLQPEEGVASTDAWLVAAAYEGGDIVVWETRRGVVRAACRGSPWTVASLAFHPDHATLASAGRNEVRLWDVMSGQLLLRAWGTSTSEARALAFSQDGALLLCGTVPGAAQPGISLWKLSPHRGIQVLRGLTAASRQVWFSPDDRWLVALSDNWCLAVWETATGRLVRLIEAPVGGFADSAAGAFDATGERLAFAAGHEARVYALPSGRVLGRWSLAWGRADRMQFDGGGRLLLARSELVDPLTGAQAWRLYELPPDRTPALLHEQAEAGERPLRLEFGLAGQLLIVCTQHAPDSPHRLAAYDVATGRQTWRRETRRTRTNAVLLVDPTGRTLVCSLDDGDVPRIFSLPDFIDQGPAPEHCDAVGPLPAQFAARDQRAWQVSKGRQGPWSLPMGDDWEAGYRPKFSPDGTRFAWGTFEGPVLLARLDEAERRLRSLARGGK
jgi:WD40 repeat protein